MTIEELQELLARASRNQGYNVSIGFYGNGSIYISGFDCRGSMVKAVAHLESLIAEDVILGPAKDRQLVPAA